MTEYIKREDLLDLYDLGDLEVENAKVPLNVVIQTIKDMPSADVVERKKGEWIQENNCYHRCSVCGDHFPSLLRISGISKEKNFCPNCGADMRPKDK